MLFCGDCLDLMSNIEDQSIDLILTDLPYSTTRCEWDVIIPFDLLWHQYNRIIKPNCAIVLTACQPFTTLLIASNIKNYKYNWIWKKDNVTGFLNAKKRPMKQTEDVCVFNSTFYYPQGLIEINKERKNDKSKQAKDRNKTERNGGVLGDGWLQRYCNYPKEIIEIKGVPKKERIHPTQKPVDLMKYLIETYTKEGGTVLDSCAGVGTTGVAAIETNRNYILMEKDENFYKIMEERLKNCLKDQK
jgi:site-specific DNA-methyltransferase (adenine-specific)